MVSKLTRRKVLQSGTVAAGIGIAGCTGNGTDDSVDDGVDDGADDGVDGNGDIELTMASGDSGTGSFSQISGWAQFLREESGGEILVNPQTTGGAGANVAHVMNHDHDLGYTSSTAAIQEADDLEPGDLHMLMSGLAWGIPFLYTTVDSGVDYIDDLVGATIAGGPPGNTAVLSLEMYFEEHLGLDVYQEADVEPVAYDEGGRMVEEGQADACMAVTVNHSPQPWAAEFITRNDDAKIVWPTEEGVDATLETYPSYSKFPVHGADNFDHAWENSVAAGEDSKPVLGSNSIFLCHPSVNEDQIYKLIDTTLENYESLAEYAPQWEAFVDNPEIFAAAVQMDDVPYNPGAERALEEHGYM